MAGPDGPLPAPLRDDFRDALLAADAHLAALVHALRPLKASSWARREAALAQAVRGLARVEDVVGPGGRIGIRADRILLVDDSTETRFIVARLVRRLHPGARVEEARDAEEALRMLADAGDGQGVLVVSDYDMGPGPSGTDLLDEVARRFPKARRVLLTGHAPESISPAAVPPDAVLLKDMAFRQLRELLVRVVALPPATT